MHTRLKQSEVILSFVSRGGQPVPKGHYQPLVDDIALGIIQVMIGEDVHHAPNGRGISSHKIPEATIVLLFRRAHRPQSVILLWQEALIISG